MMAAIAKIVLSTTFMLFLRWWKGGGQIPKATPSGTLWLNNTRWRQAKNKKLKLLVRCIVPNEIFANILGGHRQAVSK